ncbi:insulin-degrading enzyme-like 1, peroxisomal isoform X2 [Amborella trichopoda]|uniref:insulin-degrading enzyme-like 1, peroxisomal isoform X2 n=1 Tax=Amborella trichopoda TaxID=13333 RepID=UPI0009BF6C58|nr:insulin-degrading enzyme-like 1, peroxisomal isoform X2 [Amborella trichopoda]|eukprot:XP_020519710.1 insulin-degrading enzyme-like 1, peroxisomal isoform X2 [Amborella trichopoda]
MEHSINGGDLRGNERVEILKPRIDKREYRRIVLSNSLEVLLISDPDTDKCAAAMDVNVGSFSDPEGLEGLAHFLEHMLFYASEKYPLEDSYMKYITEHGGHANAFTASEHTNFQFDVNCDYFEEALDRFAQFFINPLMSPDATMREIKAVDSENQKNLLSDSWRMYQLQKHLSAKDHPYHKFSTGNWDTLEVRPKAKGLDTRDELIKFYEENYSANLMHLVVYGKKNLDDIQHMVEEKFHGIRNTARSCSIYPGRPCTSEHLQVLIKAVPVKEGHKLNIIWPVTPNIRHYKEGHEGEGSLFFVLKNLGWATSLGAGETDWSNEFSFFAVGIDLTDAGQEHMEDIVGLLFKYILLLKESGVNKWIFEEICAIGETMFHFQDKVPPFNYVARVASNMRLYPPHDWLAASSLFPEFNPDTIQMVLLELTPSNVRILWESKKFDGCTNMIEPWYGTTYSVENILDITIQQWKDGAPNDLLSLPAPNVFIPTDLSLKIVQEKAKFPVLLRKSFFSRLWFKADTLFFTPKAYVKIDFNCPESGHSPEAEVLTDIFTRLLMDYLNEYAYDAQVAGLYYSVYHTSTGFQIVSIGYNHKMRILLDTIITKVVDFKVKRDRFSVIKETVIKEYQNFKFKQPYQQASYYCSLILEDQSWPWNEALEALSHLEADDLAKFIPCLLSRAFFECYTAGNISSNEAESLVQHIEDVMFGGTQPICKPLYPSQHLTNRILKLESGVNYFYPIQGLNQQDENSALLYYIQVGQDDFRLNVKLQLFVLIAKQPAFHQLRSVEQLGYITFLTKRNDSGIQGVQFIVQSTVKDPAQLDERVEVFLDMFESKLHTMSDDEFLSNKGTLIDMKLEKHKNLREESAFFWTEIEDGTLKFDRTEPEVAALRELTKKDVIEFFNNYIKIGAPLKKKLSLQVYGGVHSSEYEAVIRNENNCHSMCIDDILSFRGSQPLYGSYKGGLGLMKL